MKEMNINLDEDVYYELVSDLDLDQEKEAVDYKYDLTGVLHHRGKAAHFGHFFVHLADEKTGEWWCFNDENVSKLKINNKRGKRNGKGEEKEKEKKNGIISQNKLENDEIIHIDIEKDENEELVEEVKKKEIENENGNGNGNENENGNGNGNEKINIDLENDNENENYLNTKDGEDERGQVGKNENKRRALKRQLRGSSTAYLLQYTLRDLEISEAKPPEILLNNINQTNINNIETIENYEKVLNDKREKIESRKLFIDKILSIILNSNKKSNNNNNKNNTKTKKNQNKILKSPNNNIEENDSNNNSGFNNIQNEIKNEKKENQNFKRYYWINKQWLDQFVNVIDEENIPNLNNSVLLCKHEKMDYKKTKSSYLIPLQAFELIEKKYNFDKILEFNDSVCKECLLEYFQRENQRYLQVQDRERLKKKLAEAKTIKPEKTEDFYYISVGWLSKWKQNYELETNFNQDINESITCEHAKLTIDGRKRTLIPKNIWVHFYSIYPNSKTFCGDSSYCKICFNQNEEIKNQKKILNKQKKMILISFNKLSKKMI